MKSLAYQYINKKQLSKTLGIGLVQQILTALSTLCLVQAGFHYNSPSKLLAWCIGSFIFHIIAPAVQIILKRWEYDLFFETYKHFIKNNLLEKSGMTSLWRRKDIKDSFIASIGVDAEGYLGAILFTGLDIFSFISSLTLGVLVLGSTIETNFIPAFLISGAISYFFYLKMNGHIKEHFEAEQIARTSFNSHILGAWDNIFLKNSSVIQHYKNSFERKYSQAKQETKNAATASEYLVFALGLVSAVPIIILVLWIGIKSISENQTPTLLALLATIPRQLNMMTTFRNTFQSMAAWIGYEAKLKVIHQTINVKPINFQNQIDLRKIEFQQTNYQILSVLEEDIKKLQPGRYEIRGENGAGKSTLLLHLNSTLQNSFYLPSNPHLVFSESEVTGSSGEKLLRHLDYLRGGSDQVLLLDEWDANLDNRNILRTEKILDQLAETRVVLEVRHRGLGNI